MVKPHEDVRGFCQFGVDEYCSAGRLSRCSGADCAEEITKLRAEILRGRRLMRGGMNKVVLEAEWAPEYQVGRIALEGLFHSGTAAKKNSREMVDPGG